MLKSKFKVKIISLFLITMILITAYSFQSLNVQAAETEKKILVLIQQDNEWVVYQNMVVKSPKNNLMVKANTICKKLGLTYKNVNSKKFTISNGKTILTFTKGAVNYQYKYNSNSKSFKNTYAPYTSKIDGTNYNVVHYNSLSKLANTKYFSTKNTEYQKQGYDGVIVFSIPEKNLELPKSTSVITEKGNNFFVPTPDPTKVPENTTTPKPDTNKTTTIGGVKVPVVDGFVSADSDTNGWFGNDNDDSHKYYDATNEFSDYIYEAMTNLGETVTEGISYVKYLDNSISISPYGNHSMEQSMSLYKNESENQYELVIKTKLVGHEQATIDQNSLKLLIAAFTSDINTLYKAIYSEWEGNNDYGINKETFVTVGNCKVKYVSSNGQGYGTYIIKSK